MARVRPPKWKRTRPPTRPVSRPVPGPSRPGSSSARGRPRQGRLATNSRPDPSRSIRSGFSPLRDDRSIRRPEGRSRSSGSGPTRSPQMPQSAAFDAADSLSHSPGLRTLHYDRPDGRSDPKAPARYERDLNPPRPPSSRNRGPMRSADPVRASSPGPNRAQESVLHPRLSDRRDDRRGAPRRYEREPPPSRMPAAPLMRSKSPPRKPALQRASYEREPRAPSDRERQGSGYVQEQTTRPPPGHADDGPRAFSPGPSRQDGLSPSRSHTPQDRDVSQHRPEITRHSRPAAEQKLLWSREEHRPEHRPFNIKRYVQDLPPARSRTAREISRASSNPRRRVVSPQARAQESSTSVRRMGSPDGRSDDRRMSDAECDREPAADVQRINISRSPEREERTRQGLQRPLGDELAVENQDAVSDVEERTDSATERPEQGRVEHEETSPTDGSIDFVAHQHPHSCILTPPCTPPGLRHLSPAPSITSETVVLDVLDEDDHSVTHSPISVDSPFHENSAPTPITASLDTRTTQPPLTSAATMAKAVDNLSSREFCRGKILPIVRLSFESKFPGRPFDAEQARALLTDERCEFFVRKAHETREQLRALSGDEGQDIYHPDAQITIQEQELGKERGVKRKVEDVYAGDDDDEAGKREKSWGGDSGVPAKTPPKEPRAMRLSGPGPQQSARDSRSPERSVMRGGSANASGRSAVPTTISVTSSSTDGITRSMDTSSDIPLASATAINPSIQYERRSQHESLSTPPGLDGSSAILPVTPVGHGVPTPGPFAEPTSAFKGHLSAPPLSGSVWADFESTPWYGHASRAMDVDASQPGTLSSSTTLTPAPPEPVLKPPTIATLYEAPPKPTDSALASIDGPYGVWLAVRGAPRAGVYPLAFDVDLHEDVSSLLEFRVLALPANEFADLCARVAGARDAEQMQAAVDALVRGTEGGGAERCRWPGRLVIDVNKPPINPLHDVSTNTPGQQCMWTMRDFKNGYLLDVSPVVRPGRNTLRLVQLSDLSDWAFVLCTTPKPKPSSSTSPSSFALGEQKTKEGEEEGKEPERRASSPGLGREPQNVSRTVVTSEMVRACWPGAALTQVGA